MPPLTEEKPWYPDDGPWKEVPSHYRSRPPGLGREVMIEPLYLCERQDKKLLGEEIEPAELFEWDQPADYEWRIVAYKVHE